MAMKVLTGLLLNQIDVVLVSLTDSVSNATARRQNEAPVIRAVAALNRCHRNPINRLAGNAPIPIIRL